MTKDKPVEKIKELGSSISKQILKGDNPAIDVPIRALSNVFFDKKSRTLQLGESSSKRSFFNIAHAKKFLQTVEVAKIEKDLLDSGKHASLRDVFYMAKRTIPNTNVNLVDEQNESLSPDEPILVRLNGNLNFISGEDLLKYAECNGEKVFDQGKEKYKVDNLTVCSFNEVYSIKEMPVTSVIKHPGNRIVKISTSCGKSVKVTTSHSVFTSRDGIPVPVAVKNLKVGDYVAIPRRISVNIKKNRIDIVKSLILNCPPKVLAILSIIGDRTMICEILTKIDKGKLRRFIERNYNGKDKFYYTIGNWKRSGIPLRLVKELDLDLSNYYDRIKISCKGAKHAYNCLINCDKDLGIIFGLLLSEGSHSLGNRRGERAVTVSNKQKSLLKIFKDSFSRCFGEEPAGEINYNKDGTYGLNVGYDLLSYLFEFCLEYPVCRAWDKRIPSFFLDADEETIASLIKFYRLGDGSIYSGRGRLIRFHTTSLALVNGVMFLLLRMGIMARVYERPPKNFNCHLSYEVRVGNRVDVIKLSKITGDFVGINIDRPNTTSSDRLINIGGLLKNNVDRLRLNDKAYRRFNWYGLAKQKTVGRETVNNAINLLIRFGDVDERLKLINKYDIAWDRVVKIDGAGYAPYTIDLCVPGKQNFIGGNGLIILHNSDEIIQDLELISGLSREQLHVNANKMGSVAGNVVIEDRGDTIDWGKLGSGGWSIPSNVEEIKFKKVNANFVLYMEKSAIYERLLEDKFHEKNKGIILSSQGQTTRGIRRLLQRLYEEFKLPIYVLCDWDIYGAYIYSVIKYGSINLAFFSKKLTIPSVQYLGITSKDIEKYDLKKHLIKLKDTDVKRMQQVADYEWFKDNKEWQEEFKVMKKWGAKAEIQALSARGISFITDKYLPDKLKEKEFLE